MPADSRFGRGAAHLTDRHGEREVLDEVLRTVRSGRSRCLLVQGEPGVGKTALLEYLTGRADHCRVLRAAGVQSEMELAFAGLHQLCAPLMHRVELLPPPQQSALRTALGVGVGPPPDRFLVGLAVLTLLSGAAEESPLICVVDDEQWLDRASALVLGFVARRLAADPVALVFAARTASPHLAGVPLLEVGGLEHAAAQELLEGALAGPLDAQVRDLIVVEARGNPLALLELPRLMTSTQFAGGFGLPSAVPLSWRIEEGFRQQVDALPAPSRRLLQLAAADPSGDTALVRRASERLGIPVEAAEPAVEAGLVSFDVALHFRHPLVRSAAYRSASQHVQLEVHRALAEVTDPVADPDRRAWHRAHAAAGPDEDVAAELERSAGRAQARGGLAAASAFLERAVHLTADPARHAERSLAAARATMAAGSFGRARELVATAEAGPLTEPMSARADLLRAELAFVSGLGDDAPPLLLKAAERLEPIEPDLARETYLNAWMAASFAGRMVGAGSMEEISRAARALPPAEHPRPIDLLLDGLTLLFTEGRAAAAPALRRAATRFARGDLTREEGLRFGWMAAALVWDDDAAHAIQDREARLARTAGALDHLPIALVALALSEAWRGEFGTAAALIAETDGICEMTGSHIAPYTAMFLAALRGNPAELSPLVEASVAQAQAGGQGAAITYGSWVSAILANGLGRYAEALAAARRATDDKHLYVSMWALPELVEAAVRCGEIQVAAHGMELLTQTTSGGGTDFGLGLEARARALLGQAEAAEESYREAIDRLGRAGIRTELARAHLLYGEWLRRAGRRSEARVELRTSHELLGALGMRAFAERARRELLATGEKVRRRTVEAPSGLTPHEALIARLAAGGMTNPEIGAQLYLSARTVEWHLRKVFTKLGITSRRELRGMGSMFG
jgi:DNA-binding CsgD family transcriptional regulator/tetratricopeptide (TPR) repeat protein